MREERNTSVNLEQDSEPGAAQTLQTPGRSDGTRGRGISRSRKASRGRRTSEIRENAEKRDNSVSREGTKRRSGRRRISIPVILLALAVGFGAGFGTGWLKWEYERPYTVDLKAVEVPAWVEQDFIRKNIFSRPDVSLKRVNSIVIHYVANPGSTAQANRDYFDGLADQDPEAGGTSTSAHFVVGLEGEGIQCIPVTEMAYAAAPRNDDTISIENCHPDDSGSFNQATYDSLVKLTACLCSQLHLTEKDVIRHYDVSGKECPKYYVEHEDEWRQFQEDVKNAMKEKSWLQEA